MNCVSDVIIKNQTKVGRKKFKKFFDFDYIESGPT